MYGKKDMKQDMSTSKKVAKAEVKAHEARMHKGGKKMANGGKVYMADGGMVKGGSSCAPGTTGTGRRVMMDAGK